MSKKLGRRGRTNDGLDAETGDTAVAAVAEGDSESSSPSSHAEFETGTANRRSSAFENNRAPSSIAEERSDVFKIIVDLEAQLESTFSMKEALESDLESTRKELGDLRWSKKELEARVKVLDGEAAATADLQTELAFAEEEKARALEQSQDLEEQIQKVTENRDSLKTTLDEAQSHLQDSEKARGDLEAQVFRFSEKIRSLEEMQADLSQVQTERDKSVDRVREQESELNSIKTANKALDLALRHSEQAAKELRSDKKRFEKAQTELLDEKRAARARFDRVEEENQAATARIAVLDGQIADLSGRNQSLDAEMDAARMTLGEIHTALADTKAKARKRYYRVKKS